MIHEQLEVMDYLEGKNINKKCLYRICSLIAKWYARQGFAPLEIREKLFDWGHTHNVYIDCNVNSLIRHALETKQTLCDPKPVRINQKDLAEITKRFDSKNSRLTALALLCYAKAFADSDGCFTISLSALAGWLQINDGNLKSRVMPQLIDFHYVEKLTAPKQTYTWRKTVKTKATRLKILVPFDQEGSFELQGNEIHELYRQVFSEP